jgi:hypothetical protein
LLTTISSFYSALVLLHYRDFSTLLRLTHSSGR